MVFHAICESGMASECLRRVWCNKWTEAGKCGFSCPFQHTMDDLLTRVQKSTFGAKLGGMPVGCVISPTVKGLQTILDISEKFAHENQLRFNIKKSATCVFSKKF